MSAIEAKLRDALREMGEQVPEGGTLPLRLPVGQADGGHADVVEHQRTGRPAAVRTPARSRLWLTPAAAAAAVLAIAVGAGALAALGHRQPPSRPQQQPGQVPPYYVAIHYVPHSSHLAGQVRADAVLTATRTGAELATIHVPKGYFGFAAVTAAADDKTFVLAAQKAPRLAKGVPVAPRTKFFRLTIHPSAATPAQRVQLTALPVPAVPRNVNFLSFALSPDGSRLAVSTCWTTRTRPAGIDEVRVSDLRTGKGSAWVFYGHPWTRVFWQRDNRTLAFLGPGRHDNQWTVLRVNTAATRASEHVALRLTSRPGVVWRDEFVTPDGRTVILARLYPRPEGKRIDGSIRLQKYGIRTGHLTSTVDVRKVWVGESDSVLWSDPSGRVLIVTVPLRPYATGPGIHTQLRAGIFVGGRFMQIPWSRYASTAAW